jgi:hypothetical protein
MKFCLLVLALVSAVGIRFSLHRTASKPLGKLAEVALIEINYLPAKTPYAKASQEPPEPPRGPPFLPTLVSFFGR